MVELLAFILAVMFFVALVVSLVVIDYTERGCCGVLGAICLILVILFLFLLFQ